MSTRSRSTTSSSVRRLTAVLALLAGAASASAEDIAVVAGPDSALRRLSADEARALFVQDQRGGRLPLDLPESDPARTAFYLRLAGKNQTMMRALRANLVFTGRGRPPLEQAPTAVIQRLLDDPQVVGYLPASTVPEHCHVLLLLPGAPPRQAP